jgi:hypothetical protein
MQEETVTTQENVQSQRLETGERQSRRHFYYAIVLLVIVFFGLIRFRLRNMPLERDEGEYAYAGQLILQGIPPYQLAYNFKLPGTYAAYAVILVLFGQTPGGVHLGLLLVNSLTILLMYLLATRLFASLAGIVAAATYGVLSIDPQVLGFAGHATHFVVLASLGGILLLLRAIQSGSRWTLAWSGFLMGLGFLMKQPGIFFVIFAGLYLLKSEDRQDRIEWPRLGKNAAVFALSAAFPFGLTCLILLWAGVFRAFWFWTISYARQYASSLSLAQGYRVFVDMFPRIAKNSSFIWLIAGLGLVALVLNPRARRHAFFVLSFLLFSFLAVCPGFYFREHYFILLLPAVSLLTGMAVSSATQGLGQIRGKAMLAGIPVVVLIAAFSYSIFRQREFLFVMDPSTACRSVYQINPFPEALEIAAYIRSHTADSAKIAVLGSEPEIYFYSHRHSATGYIYTYGLMEPQKYAFTMQREMIHEVESAQPEFLVFVGIQASWLAQAGSPQEVAFFTWAQPFIAENYERAGVVDIFRNATQYRWGDEARLEGPTAPFYVEVFKRRPSSR